MLTPEQVSTTHDKTHACTLLPRTWQSFCTHFPKVTVKTSGTCAASLQDSGSDVEIGVLAGEPGQVRTRLGTGTADVRGCASSLLLLQNEADPLPSTEETHNRSSLQAPSHPNPFQMKAHRGYVPPQLVLSAAELRLSCLIASGRRIYLLTLNIQKLLKTEPRDTKMCPRPEIFSNHITESSLFSEAR